MCSIQIFTTKSIGELNTGQELPVGADIEENGRGVRPAPEFGEMSDC